MCTILTFDKAFYNVNEKAITAQLMQDSLYNPDGYAMLSVGNTSESVNLFRSMSIDVVIALLKYNMEQGNTERVWIHCRMATTAMVNINGCHGFDGGKYVVMHNGGLSRPESRQYNVDSQLIADDVNKLGLPRALNNLQFDYFANVFFINAETGEYTVSRRIGGSLHTDGQGNYSTNVLGSILVPVLPNTVKEYSKHLIASDSKPYVYEGWDNQYKEYGEYSPPVSDGYVQEEIDELLEYLKYSESRQDLRYLAESEDWFTNGVPDKIKENMTLNQLRWSIELGLLGSYEQEGAA